MISAVKMMQESVLLASLRIDRLLYHQSWRSEPTGERQFFRLKSRSGPVFCIVVPPGALCVLRWGM
jgi:hypothetical protein